MYSLNVTHALLHLTKVGLVVSLLWLNTMPLQAQEYSSPVHIRFFDKVVKAICVEHWDTDGDGEISYAEAAAVTSLGQAFTGNKHVTRFDELKFFTGISCISEKAFLNAFHLEHITVPDNVKHIEAKAFWSCIRMTGLVMSDSLTEIAPYAFYHCTSLQEFKVPVNVCSIGAHAFEWCTGLQQVNMSDRVRYIGESAFRHCEELFSIGLSSALDSLRDSTFFDSRRLQLVEIRRQTPPHLPSSVFPKNVFSYATLEVPEGCRLAYGRAPVWNRFCYVMETIPARRDY